MRPAHKTPQRSAAPQHARGLTLVELMVVVAVVVVLLVVAAPSLRDFIETQRHKAVHAELSTDVQFARSEAVSRSDWIFMQFGVRSDDSTCYTVFTCSAADAGSPDPTGCACDCGSLPCTGATQEQRTVVADVARGVSFIPEVPALRLRFDPRTGGMRGFNTLPTGGLLALDQVVIETLAVRREVRLRALVSGAGRVSNCSPSGAVSGYPPC